MRLLLVVAAPIFAPVTMQRCGPLV